MRTTLVLSLWITALFIGCTTAQQVSQSPSPSNTPQKDPFTAKTENLKAFEGYFDFFYDEKSGKIMLSIDRFDQEFLYVNSLTAGVGSNDIGLDRGQLGNTRVVKFIRSGPKVMLIQPNQRYRAVTNNADEKRSVEEAFAQSVIWGARVEAEKEGKVLVDLTPFLLRDSHNLSGRLQRGRQGSYRLDANRSAIYLPFTKNFPKNSEFEALLTFTGNPQGSQIRSVVPSAEAVTVRMHHSFVELPDGNYKPRKFDPRSSFNAIRYQDYATPIDAPLVKQFIRRHRLEKKNPSAAISEAVEPIVYYVDRGAPEPIRSALIEGAKWWNQAFEAAGYDNAFQVKVMPEGADPMDVRYNLIQWVHRSTRGWSYGASVSDPRTGEIIKGHVSLGSLRVRQDFLITQGLVKAYEAGKPVSPEMLKLALARLRQLSAHEVGHTIGLMHNFAASVDGRSSVMDYPHPLILMDENGNLDFSKSYDVGIGAFDKRSVLWGYQDFPEGTDEEAELQKILGVTYGAMKLNFISDQDARPKGGAHPLAHLWDNGKRASEELDRMLILRKKAMSNFGEHNIAEGEAMAMLEDVLVPLYFSHRYQVEATAKVLGGVFYSYAVRGGDQVPVRMISAATQKAAFNSLINTLKPENLEIPENILQMIPPRPVGYPRGREHFKIKTGFTLDPLAAAEAASNHTLAFMLDAQRANRLVEFAARDQSYPGYDEIIDELISSLWKMETKSSYHEEILRLVQSRSLQHMMVLGRQENATPQVRAIINYKLNELADWLDNRMDNVSNGGQRAHYYMSMQLIEAYLDDPEEWEALPVIAMPDGSPIGMDCQMWIGDLD
ncbi:MAG: zinc-dependent metalloprotease [Bacteroidota bacterium]